MNQKKKKDREKRVKEKLSRRREIQRKEANEQKKQERFAYLSRQKQTPVVKNTDSALVRNNKVLQGMLAEYEALIQFRAENKTQASLNFDETKKQYDKIVEETKTNGTSSDI